MWLLLVLMQNVLAPILLWHHSLKIFVRHHPCKPDEHCRSCQGRWFISRRSAQTLLLPTSRLRRLLVPLTRRLRPLPPNRQLFRELWHPGRTLKHCPQLLTSLWTCRSDRCDAVPRRKWCFINKQIHQIMWNKYSWYYWIITYNVHFYLFYYLLI